MDAKGRPEKLGSVSAEGVAGYYPVQNGVTRITERLFTRGYSRDTRAGSAGFSTKGVNRGNWLMYGEKRELLPLRCKICQQSFPTWVDREDIQRGYLQQLSIAESFCDRNANIYVDTNGCTLLSDGMCVACWQRLRADNSGLCRRCGKPGADAATLCPECTETVQLCETIGQFINGGYLPNLRAGNVDLHGTLVQDFSDVVMVFAFADGSAAPSELMILADLLCIISPVMVKSDNAMQAALDYAQDFIKSHPQPAPSAPRSLGFLAAYDKATGNRAEEVFRGLLFRLANIVAKADGTVTTIEIKFLRYYEAMLQSGWGKSEQPTESVSQKAALTNAASSTRAQSVESAVPVGVPVFSLDELLAELNGLIGLDNVKGEVLQLTNFLQVEKLKRSRGLKPAEMSLHLVFHGNPGTGKTTVARLIARIYHALGFLKQGQLVEAERSKLVGGYLGQTAIKTAEVIEQALGGVLFIDEAYSLARDKSSQDTYGEEAIEVLLKNMEDHRSDLVVIAAGYPAEMADFLNSNPGLKSRFNRFLDFEDYSPEQLFKIFGRFATDAQYVISDHAAEKLHLMFDVAYNNRDRQFGNARFVRNVFERAISNLASRIVTIPRVTDQMLTTIEAADVPSVGIASVDPEPVPPRHIGFAIQHNAR